VTVLVITGTDTGVGKTIATAALACNARLVGRDVAVCKPAQTGVADGDDDLREIGRLARVEALTPGWRYPEPLAPVAAARRADMPLPDRRELLELVRSVDGPDRLTLVEGAGGLLVTLGRDGVTLRDLAVDLGAAVLLVVAPGLGTLNHTALNLEALAAQSIPCAGLVVGAWPAEPGVAESDNREELARLAPLRAVLPAGAGAMTPDDFAAMSAGAFDDAWVRTL
jgi:dethiobiotin synthetase